MPSSTSPEHNEDPALAPRPVRMLPRSARPQGLYDLSLDELTAKLVEAGFPAFRAKQLWHWVYQQLASNYDEMTNLPADLRAWLNANLPLATMPVILDSATDDGETHKLLYQTGDGQFVETVLMLYPERATVCVSCQIGCAVGCAFARPVSAV
ncbi:MAG: hypothetical protein R2843_02600 [Thermomicrobiales bacterium]